MVKKSSKKRDKDNINQYAKYSGLAFQMFLSLAVAAYIGQYLDKKLELSNSYITLVLILIVFSAFMYKIVKELS